MLLSKEDQRNVADTILLATPKKGYVVSTNVHKLWITCGPIVLPNQVGTASTGILDCSTSLLFVHGRLDGFRRSEAYVEKVANVAQVMAVTVLAELVAVAANQAVA